MATPAAELILDDLQTTLEGITASNGYKTTVKNVDRVVKHWENVSAALRPWVGYMPQNSTYEHYPYGKLRVTMPVYIAAHVTNSTKESTSEDITNLVDDIVAALMVDPTRGGAATLTRVISQQDDTGDNASTDRHGVSGTIEIIVNVIYHRDTSKS